jgi:hypothetical protein
VVSPRFWRVVDAYRSCSVLLALPSLCWRNAVKLLGVVSVCLGIGSLGDLVPECSFISILL